MWRGEGYLSRWRKAVILPDFKKGDKNFTSNYRGITLLDTSYKIYAALLAGKLNEEIEGK